MGDRFFNADHIHQKLHNTVCLFKGVPYYVQSAGGEDMQCTPLDGSKRFVVKYTDEAFDYTHIPLGYMTVGNRQAYYLTREPRRIAAQGLVTTAIRSIPESLVHMENLILRKDFIDCVKGDHMPFADAMALLRGEAESISISRHMAIEKKSNKIFMALYRGRPVAISQDKGNTFSPVEHKGSHLIVKRLRNHDIPLAM